MELVTEEAAAAAQPTDKELADYVAANPAEFRAEPRITFSQEFLGGRLAMVEPRYENVTPREVARVFGQEFAAALQKQSPGALGRAGRLRIRCAPGPGREHRSRRTCGRSRKSGRWPSASGATQSARR